MPLAQPVYSFQVKEDTVPGAVVGRVQAVYQVNSRPVTYSVLVDDGDKLFLLNRLSGDFLLSRGLDFETQRFYILTVGVQEEGGPLSGVRVYFNVLDVNDNPPEFKPDSYSASLLEDAPTGTCFLLLNVHDEDADENSKLDLQIFTGDDEHVFSLDPAGRLCLNSELDREKKPSYNLTVTASDCPQISSQRFTSTAQVVISVHDINDNPPVFMSAQSVAIPEDSALHVLITTVHAEDADSGSNGEVFYYVNDSISSIWVSVHNTSGHVHLRQLLDRERDDAFTVAITAVDKGSPQMASTMNLTVHIEDVNDHHPEFPQKSYSLAVREDIPRGSSVFRAQAWDADLGANGEVRYTLSQTSPFAVDAVRGVVIVMEELDRERQSNYTLTVMAADRGSPPRSSAAVIGITVSDVNDFTPVFSPAIQTVHVMENEEDLSQFTQLISAWDEDVGINSQLTYLTQSGNEDSLFSLSPNGTFHVLTTLDREKQPRYILSIIAVDAGWPPLTGTLTIEVVVDDENDNRPLFHEDVYNTIVPEDSPAGTVFAIITATDLDQGDNGEIRYSIVGPDSPFFIEETSGELSTTDVLDRETVAVYNLTVISSDKHSTHPLSSAVLVNILVGDVNDHWPQFQNSPYVAHIPTAMDPESVVCTVRATDGDTEMNAELKFSLYGPSVDLFTINPRSGTVFTSSFLTGREGLTINVRVEDSGEVPNFDITTISVIFHNGSEFPVVNVDIVRKLLFEDAPVGTLVAIVNATSPRPEPIYFYLASGDTEERFQMDESSGEITVQNPLDYENKKSFTLLVEARDSGSPPFSSFAEFHVNIRDVNDNLPQFMQSEFRCDIFENLLPVWVCDVLAIDADSGSYGMVHYSIVKGNPDSHFIIDSENGELSTTLSLDREDIADYNLTVEATDQDNPLHRARATVVVVVLDRNDHAPRFSQIFRAEIPEDAPIGHTVVQVISADDDSDENAEITFSIIKRNDIPFSIDNTNGFITVMGQLDREEQDHYIVRVNANDSAWSISTDVTIVILDVNDNKPVFSHTFPTVILPEAKAQEEFVFQVIATDADTGKNSEVVYTIEPPVDHFWVNATSGEIYTTQPMALHFSPFEVFNLTVFAYDCGITSLFANTTVTVRLVPYNYHPPTFLPSPSKVSIPFDLPIGTEVVQFSAVDKDSNHSPNEIEYGLTNGKASDWFWIQADIGKITLNGSLREHLSEVWTLSVTAKDSGYPPLTSQVEITFEIIARNHFSPNFAEPVVVFSIPEDLAVGSVIGKIQAEDEDSGANGVVTYSIRQELEYLPFSLGKSSALLSLIRELDFEKQRLYRFQIEAVDGGWSSKMGITNITVNIVDVNDNHPAFGASEFVASVPENSEIGTIVFIAKATDPDSTTNAQITYSLISGDVERFSVDSVNGIITTADVFDYEREQIFDVTVKASNMGAQALFSVAHVVIKILDINEFIPTFRIKEYNFSVFAHDPIGTRVGKVTATDLDQGPEGEVFYLLFGQNKNLEFEIDRRSGEIYTTGSLRMHGNSPAVLTVLAKNRGIISGTNVDEGSVRISIIEVNNAPEFTPTVYSINVKENIAIGTSIVRVSAVDQDSIWYWNQFFFSIKHGNINTTFAIHPLSGVISVHLTLDREQWAHYNLSVTATDKGSPPATGTANVLVTVDDINDNAPRLGVTQAQVKENQPQGTIVARLNASDLDLPPNQGPFTFWVVKPMMGSAFSLTADGILFTTRSLDREVYSVYHVAVAVRDAGTPPLTSTTVFHISVLDENDNPYMQRSIHIEVKYYGSSFQGGRIGHVNLQGDDGSHTFNCSIKTGRSNMFDIPYGTCELWSAPFQGEATYNITIEATDLFLFPVNHSVYVNYKGFTNASMDSCILFYVSSSSIHEFLTHKYLTFVKALDSLFNLQASKTHVFGIKGLETEILLLAAVKSYNGQYLSREEASGISTGHRKVLEAQTNVTISHITSDPCLTIPCKNGATCGKNIHISPNVAVLESSTVIFASPQMEIFNCTCSAGFTGTLCEADIDECESNPCRNKGTCVNNHGGFYCHCQSGFFGPFCTTDFDECPTQKCQNGGSCVKAQDAFHCLCDAGYKGDACEQLVDHCESGPCIQGKCINSLMGFLCQCPFGVSGVRCEQDSIGFEELSFMEFPPLDPRSNLISLEVATVQQNCLLLYNPGGASHQDFMALELVEGRVRFSFDLGAGPVRLEMGKRVADGLFHTITAKRIGNIGSILVDGCTDVDRDRFCFSQSDGFGSERILNVGSGNMTFGGLRSIGVILVHPGQVRTHDFVGCVRNIHVNGRALTPDMALGAHNILQRCPRKMIPPCHSSPCQNGGLCNDRWSHSVCECKSPYTGRTCATEMSEDFVVHFSGKDYIECVFKERYKRDILLKDLKYDGLHDEVKNKYSTLIEIKFKTRNNGVLMSVIGNNGYTMLTLKDQKLHFTLDNTSGFAVEAPVADGLWHILSVISDGQNAVVYLDEQAILNTTRGIYLTPVTLDRIVLGQAVPQLGSRLQVPGFSGCVEYFKVAGYTLPGSRHSDLVEVIPSPSLLQTGCPTSSSPSCLPSPCPAENYTLLGDEPLSPQGPEDGWWQACGGPGQESTWACICLHNSSSRSCDVCSSVRDQGGECSSDRWSAPLWVIAVLLLLLAVAVGITVVLTLRHLRARQDAGWCQNKRPPQRTATQGTEKDVFDSDDVVSVRVGETVEERRPPDILNNNQSSGVCLYHEADATGVQRVPQGSELDYYEIDSYSITFHSDADSLKRRATKHCDGPCCTRADPRERGGDIQNLSKSKKYPLSHGRTTKSERPKRLSPSLHPELRPYVDTYHLLPCHPQGPKRSAGPRPVQALSAEEVRQLNDAPQQIVRPKMITPTTTNVISADCGTGSGSEFERGQHAVTGHKDVTDTRLAPGSLISKHPSNSTPAGAPEKWENILNTCVQFSAFAGGFEDIASLPSEIKCDTQADLEELI
ncbi:unnamed protein product [Lota lota]